MFISYTTSHVCLGIKDRIVHDIHKPNVGNQTLCDNDKRDRLNKCPTTVVDPLESDSALLVNRSFISRAFLARFHEPCHAKSISFFMDSIFALYGGTCHREKSKLTELPKPITYKYFVVCFIVTCIKFVLSFSGLELFP